MFVKVVGSDAVMMSGSIKIVPENGGWVRALWPAKTITHRRRSLVFFIWKVTSTNN
jgi:hypothetical protein